MFYLNLLENPQRPKSNFWFCWIIGIALILLAWSLSGCSMKQYCAEHYPTKDSTSVRDSIICIKDTIYLEPEQITFHDSIPCPDYHGTASNGHLTATIDIKKGKLSVECDEAALRKVIDSQAHVIHIYQSKKAETIREVVMKTPWYATFCIWYFVLTIIVLLGIIGWKAISAKIPIK